jgi:hypothetical protein
VLFLRVLLSAKINEQYFSPKLKQHKSGNIKFDILIMNNPAASSGVKLLL